MGPWAPNCIKRMPDVNFVEFFLVFRCEVEISWALLGAFYAVVGTLDHNREGELITKVILVQLAGGDRLVGRNRGRTAPSQKKTFDNTMGFPGEDVTVQPRW